MIRQLLFAVLLLTALSGCNKKSPENVAVIVNGYEITNSQVLQTAEMLRESIIAAFPEKAVEGVIEQGYRTPDIAEPDSITVSTSRMGDMIKKELNNR